MKTIKKFLPYFCFIVLLVSVLTGKLVFEHEVSTAGQLSPSQERNTHYEKLFSEVSLDTISGNKLNLSKITSPVVIVNFWASWCAPCLKEIPSFVEIVKKFGDKVKIIGVNNDEDNAKGKVAKLSKEYGINYPIFIDNNNELTEKFMISTIPVTIVYVNGKVAKLFTEEYNFTSDEFISFLEESSKRE